MKKNRWLIGGLILGGIFMGAMVCVALGLIGHNVYLLVGALNDHSPGGVSVNTAPSPTLEVQRNGTGHQEPLNADSMTLSLLENEVVPINDPIELAIRLGKVDSVPRKKPVDTINRSQGDKETFWVTNVDTSEHFQVETTLAAVTDHAYYWVEDGVDYSQKNLRELADTFEREIYPTNHAFFGTEWNPGVDEDPHLYIIYARGLGSNIAGYFSSVDEYHPRAHEYSNAHETFMLNADNVDFGQQYTYSVLAHEFQHMIHWYQDRNETAWLNEGFSELATLLNEFRFLGGFDSVFAQDPDLQLTDWPNDPMKTTPHYGSSFLFVTYFLDRFGNEATQALVSSDLNGMASVDRVLKGLQVEDPSGDPFMDGDDFFLDWAITNYVKDKLSDPGIYQYHNYPESPRLNSTETIDQCPTKIHTREVHQYGVDYIRLKCEGEFTLQFSGEETVRLLPVDPRAGEFAYWSNKGDQSDMTLTREFDFSDVSGPLTFRFWTWYDLEEDYDYLYLEASTDGENWTILKTPSGTKEDPSGNSYGWAYNGLSGGDGKWIEEEVDLSRFAGEKVLLRFEYITDAAVHGEGFLVDDVEIPQIGYQTGFETDQGGWEDQGFVRVRNELPQTYRLALLKLGKSPEVQYLNLSDLNELRLPLVFNEMVEEQILIVSGTTRFTRQKAGYKFQIRGD